MQYRLLWQPLAHKAEALPAILKPTSESVQPHKKPLAAVQGPKAGLGAIRA
jgi:hypothetical protein